MNKSRVFDAVAVFVYLSALIALNRTCDWIDKVISAIIVFTNVCLMLKHISMETAHWLFLTVLCTVVFSSKFNLSLLSVPVLAVTILSRLRTGGCLFGAANGKDKVLKRGSWSEDVRLVLGLIFVLLRLKKGYSFFRDEHRIALGCLFGSCVCYKWVNQNPVL